ncbi:MAG TPA: tetratricopeptide repeat protein, partial [Polyangiaceae bacterium]|nr:tetratricopeptide repeat protein [Polyangiaceae bacterium]
MMPHFGRAGLVAAGIFTLACGGPKAQPPLTPAERLNAEALRRLERGDDLGAEAMMKGALKEAELVDDLVGEAEAWNNLGALAMARGNAREAWASHATALSLHQATGKRALGEVRTRSNLGSALLGVGKVAEAKAQFEEAIRLAERLENPRAGRLARVGLAAALLANGDAAGARALAETAVRPAGSPD